MSVAVSSVVKRFGSRDGAAAVADVSFEAASLVGCGVLTGVGAVLQRARVPEGVPAEDAAYGTVAAIALHGVRLAGLGLGDVAAVVGLGLVGQLAVELLVASGCVVVGVDPDPTRVDSPPGPILIIRQGLFFRVSPSFDPNTPAVNRAVAACGQRSVR